MQRLDCPSVDCWLVAQQGDAQLPLALPRKGSLSRPGRQHLILVYLVDTAGQEDGCCERMKCLPTTAVCTNQTCGDKKETQIGITFFLG
uniref:Uncharacterized protein n=1 Tax=Anguilla anguilla TaxID=7936 RepID=A0A0E9QBC1_ANGAN